jgi:hypothetical protein
VTPSCSLSRRRAWARPRRTPASCRTADIRDGFSARIERRRQVLDCLLPPCRNQTPSHGNKLARTVMNADHVDHRRRRNVVARRKVAWRLGKRIKLCQLAPRVVLGKSSAHAVDDSRSRAGHKCRDRPGDAHPPTPLGALALAYANEAAQQGLVHRMKMVPPARQPIFLKCLACLGRWRLQDVGITSTQARRVHAADQHPHRGVAHFLTRISTSPT